MSKTQPRPTNGKTPHTVEAAAKAPAFNPAIAREKFEAAASELPPELRARFVASWRKTITEDLSSSPDLAGLLPPIRTVSAEEILAAHFKPPVWIVPDLLPAGLTILAGRPKVGKSWLALQIAQAVASGGKVFGKDIERGKVLYLALEDHKRRLQGRMLAQRWDRLARGVDFILPDTFREEFQHLNSGGGARLAGFIRAGGYRLAVVDTFSRALKGDQKDEQEMTAAIAPLQETALSQEVAIVLIDHHKKPMGFGDPNPVDDILGSTAKGAIADAVWGLYAEQGKRGAKLAITGRDVDEIILKLTRDAQTMAWQSEGAAQEIELTERRKEILEAIQAIGTWCKVGDIGEATGQAKQRVWERLTELTNAGMVVFHSRDRNVFYGMPGWAWEEPGEPPEPPSGRPTSPRTSEAKKGSRTARTTGRATD